MFHIINKKKKVRPAQNLIMTLLMNWFFYAIYAKKCCRLFLSLRSHFYMLQKCMYTDTVNNIYGTTSMCYDVHNDLVINPPRGVVGYETA